jgi:hypothetical protein
LTTARNIEDPEERRNAENSGPLAAARSAA